MHPDYRKRSSNIGNITVKITADMSGVMAELEQLNQSVTQSKIKDYLDKIDYLKGMKKHVINDKEKSSIVRGWMCNTMDEQIEELKEFINELVYRY